LLPHEAIRQLFGAIRTHFRISEGAEITFEANPDDITSELLDVLIAVGVNRISLGIQSFNDQQLQLLRRRHSATQAIEAVRLIHRKGIPHISIDLIYGQPRQTLEAWQQDLTTALSLPIDHLSAYALSVEEATPLKRLIENQTLSLPTDETTWNMYQRLCESTRQHGFRHYEISNFCLPHAHSRHNSGYWQSRPYLGIGPGAHSYDGTYRHYNPLNLHEYIASNGLMNRQSELLSENERCNDYIFTALRTSDGLDLNAFKSQFGTARYEQILEWARPHINKDSLTLTDGILQLTQVGIFVSNDIISDLMFIDDND
jgi:oxygen-independent coproporphyrinogen-3 oxidase